MPEYPNSIDNGFRFTYGITDIEEMINQIELYLKTREKDYYLTINDIRIHFDVFKYTKSDFVESDNIYEFSFLKNNDVIAYFEAYDNYKFECHLSNDIICEINILEPK